MLEGQVQVQDRSDDSETWKRQVKSYLGVVVDSGCCSSDGGVNPSVKVSSYTGIRKHVLIDYLRCLCVQKNVDAEKAGVNVDPLGHGVNEW